MFLPQKMVVLKFKNIEECRANTKSDETMWLYILHIAAYDNDASVVFKTFTMKIGCTTQNIITRLSQYKAQIFDIWCIRSDKHVKNRERIWKAALKYAYGISTCAGAEYYQHDINFFLQLMQNINNCPSDLLDSTLSTYLTKTSNHMLDIPKLLKDFVQQTELVPLASQIQPETTVTSPISNEVNHTITPTVKPAEILPFKCKNCDYRCDSQRGVVIHNTKVHNNNETKIQCSICFNLFSTKETLRVHTKTCINKSMDTSIPDKHIRTVNTSSTPTVIYNTIVKHITVNNSNSQTINKSKFIVSALQIEPITNEKIKNLLIHAVNTLSVFDSKSISKIINEGLKNCIQVTDISRLKSNWINGDQNNLMVNDDHSQMLNAKILHTKNELQNHSIVVSKLNQLQETIETIQAAQQLQESKIADKELVILQNAQKQYDNLKHLFEADDAEMTLVNCVKITGMREKMEEYANIQKMIRQHVYHCGVLMTLQDVHRIFKKVYVGKSTAGVTVRNIENKLVTLDKFDVLFLIKYCFGEAFHRIHLWIIHFHLNMQPLEFLEKLKAFLQLVNWFGVIVDAEIQEMIDEYQYIYKMGIACVDENEFFKQIVES